MQPQSLKRHTQQVAAVAFDDAGQPQLPQHGLEAGGSVVIAGPVHIDRGKAPLLQHRHRLADVRLIEHGGLLLVTPLGHTPNGASPYTGPPTVQRLGSASGIALIRS